jgi:hypothetical protein
MKGQNCTENERNSCLDKVGQYSLIISSEAREYVALLTYELRQQLRIEMVTLARLARFASAFCGPPCVNLVDGFTGCNQILGQAAAVIPGAFDSPLAGRPESSCPLVQAVPTLWTVGSLPLIEDRAGGSSGKSLMQLLVSINSK